MVPLEVVAHLRGAVCLPNGPIALDGLLAAQVAARDNLPFAFDERGIAPIEIPVQREPGGRFHLASISHQEIDQTELRWLNRRFPVAEAMVFGDAKLRRIDITAKDTKSWRIPLATFHAEHDRLTWWCIGEPDAIHELLKLCHYVGKKRAVGLGAVDRWSVTECEPWPGFPVLRDGLPLRSLPVDWPGLRPDAERGMAVLTYPFWRRHREEEAAVPT